MQNNSSAAIGLKVACFMMQKNERELLKAWLEYYKYLFGASNLYVYDNGSDDEYVLNLLKEAAIEGVNIIYDYADNKDFENKGDIISQKIKALDNKGMYDFYFPIDCDEFLGVLKADGSPGFDREVILNELFKYKGARRAMLIKHGFDNHPGRKGFFRKSSMVRKTFFPENMCLSLDIGYHDGKSVTGNLPHTTNLVYIHYHWKPYGIAVHHTKEKMKGRLKDFSADTLLQYKLDKKPGHHLIDILLMSSEAEYISMFDRNEAKFWHLPAFENKLTELNVALPYLHS